MAALMPRAQLVPAVDPDNLHPDKAVVRPCVGVGSRSTGLAAHCHLGHAGHQLGPRSCQEFARQTVLQILSDRQNTFAPASGYCTGHVA